MANYFKIKSCLSSITKHSPEAVLKFYKTAPGHYAEHDKFIGVSVPALRKIAMKFKDLAHEEIKLLITSPINEERLLALFILAHQYKIGTKQDKENIYQLYLENLTHINNWNLVDSSAHLIIGSHLLDKNKDKELLVKLAISDIMWHRRIAIVATWQFIRNNQLSWTFKIAEILQNDSHDLIHKATGWMLREAGKKDKKSLVEFLSTYGKQMPRTMLRYAIEKFPEDERKAYLHK